MPTLSVSAIGLVGALVALVQGRRPASAALPRGLLGAWAGFLLGGTLGVVIDVVTGGGAFLAFLGHLGAVLGTIWALSAREPTRPVRRLVSSGYRR